MSQSPALDLRFFETPCELAGCFSAIYRLDVEMHEGELASDWLIPEWANLRFFDTRRTTARAADGPDELQSHFVAGGPRSKSIRFVAGRCRVWGFGLLPLGWARLIPTPACELANTIYDGRDHPAYRHLAGILDVVSDGEPDDECEYAAIMDIFAEAARPVRDAERILAAQEAIADPFLLQVPEFARRAGVSPRTLERLCQRYFGFSPNIVLRRHRLIRSLACFMIEGEKCWNEVIDEHYHDHPHFVREFQHFMGMSPTRYAEHDHPVMEAFMQNRQEVWGEPARGRDFKRATAAR